MKKSISILALAALVATASFAQEFKLSAGGGALFDLGLGNGVKSGDDEMTTTTIGFGGFAFFDATYVEAELSFLYGLAATKVPGLDDESKGSVLALEFGLLGKYPINLGALTFFPLLGVNYNLVLSVKDEDGESVDDPGDYSTLGFRAGAGVDYYLTDALYLRGEVLYNIRLPSKVYSDFADDMGGDAEATIGHGPRVKIGVGYAF